MTQCLHNTGILSPVDLGTDILSRISSSRAGSLVDRADLSNSISLIMDGIVHARCCILVCDCLSRYFRVETGEVDSIEATDLTSRSQE